MLHFCALLNLFETKSFGASTPSLLSLFYLNMHKHLLPPSDSHCGAQVGFQVPQVGLFALAGGRSPALRSFLYPSRSSSAVSEYGEEGCGARGLYSRVRLAGGAGDWAGESLFSCF
jgi:hypothetical protein